LVWLLLYAHKDSKALEGKLVSGYTDTSEHVVGRGEKNKWSLINLGFEPELHFSH
jgi:hypothetical protein